MFIFLLTHFAAKEPWLIYNFIFSTERRQCKAARSLGDTLTCSINFHAHSDSYRLRFPSCWLYILWILWALHWKDNMLGVLDVKCSSGLSTLIARLSSDAIAPHMGFSLRGSYFYTIQASVLQDMQLLVGWSSFFRPSLGSTRFWR